MTTLYGDKVVPKREQHPFYKQYLQHLSGKIYQGDFHYKSGAQFSYDVGSVYEAEDKYSDSKIRRARIYTKGSFFHKQLFYKAELSLSGESRYKSIYVGVKQRLKPFTTTFTLKAGNVKVPFSFVQQSSSKYLTFMERPLNASFFIDRKVAVVLQSSTKIGRERLNLFASVFSNSMDEHYTKEKENNITQNGYAFRGVFTHSFAKNHFFSLGAAYMKQHINEKVVRYKNGFENKMLREHYLHTKIYDVEREIKENFEFLYNYEKFAFQTEYTKLRVQALINDYNFNALYAQMSYFIRGKGRKYDAKESKLAQFKPKRGGGIEVAMRYAQLDLWDKKEQGGYERSYAYALNYYITKELKVMLNYNVDEPQKTERYDGRLQSVQARVMFAF